MILRQVVTTIFCLAFFAIAGCGASAKQSEETGKCIQRCRLSSMDCLESVDCTDGSGQLIPCEDECEQGRIECEDQC
jgi:hypothetical protein